MFMFRNKKNINTVWMKKKKPYFELWCTLIVLLISPQCLGFVESVCSTAWTVHEKCPYAIWGRQRPDQLAHLCSLVRALFVGVFDLKYPLMSWKCNEGPDQTGLMSRLICTG